MTHPAVRLDQRPRRVYREQLFVHAVAEPKPRTIAEHPPAFHVQEAGIRPAFVVAARPGLPAHDDGGRVVTLERQHRVEVVSPHQLADDRVVARGNRLVGVERQDPVAGRLRDAEVAGGAEVVLPRKVKEPGPERARDLDGPVRAAGVDDDEIIPEAAHRLEATAEVRLLVLRDETNSECHRPASSAGRGETPARPARSQRARARLSETQRDARVSAERGVLMQKNLSMRTNSWATPAGTWTKNDRSARGV